MAGYESARSSILILSLCVCLMAPFLGASTPPALAAENELTVQRDEEKTVYSIGRDNQNRKEEDQETEKAWDMLKHGGITVDTRKGHPSQGEPAQPPATKYNRPASSSSPQNSGSRTVPTQ